MIKKKSKWALFLSLFVVLYASHGLGYCGCHEESHGVVADQAPCHEMAGATDSSQGQQKQEEGCCCIKSPLQKGESVVIQIIPSQGAGRVPTATLTPKVFALAWGSVETNRVLREHHPISPHLSAKALATKQSFLI